MNGFLMMPMFFAVAMKAAKDPFGLAQTPKPPAKPDDADAGTIPGARTEKGCK